jgi:ABC-2 type transport system permease protein
VSAYWAVFSARFRALLQYRAAAVAGLGTQVFWGFIRVMIFTAFYRSTTLEPPMALSEVITYVWLTQALLMLLPWRPDPEVETLVRSGNVAYELLRPVDLYHLWYARSVALRVAPTLLRSVPMVVLALPWFGMALPAGPGAAAGFSLAVLGSVLLGAAMTTLLSISLLFTVSGRGIHVLTISLVNICSGAIVPLPLFPAWSLPWLQLLPFRGLMDAPFQLYLGTESSAAAWGVLTHQLAWTLTLVLFGRWLVERARRRMVVQGG